MTTTEIKQGAKAEYKVMGLARALAEPCSTKAFTLDDLSASLKELYRECRPQAPEYPRQHINWVKIAQLGIGFHYEGDLVLMSSSGLRRARECGAIWDEDENGERLPCCTAISEPEIKPTLTINPETRQAQCGTLQDKTGTT